MTLQKGMITALGLTVMIGFSQCGDSDTVNNKSGTTASNSTMLTADSDKGNEKTKEPERSVEAVVMKYTAWPIKKIDTAVKAFKAKYTGEERWTILALNRLDEGNIRRADTLIIPEQILPDFNQYCPFPASVPLLRDVNKFVIFSYAIQAFAAYEHGSLVYWGPTSMGSKIHPTPTGLHFSNWKAKETISTVNDEWKLKWNFNIENKEGVGWHQYAMPGYPASHSCLRMLEKQARWMYDWADQWILEGSSTVLAQGTPVIVYGAYPFGSRRPWLNLLNDPDANTVSEADISKEIQPHLERIMQQQERRAKVVQGRLPAKDSSASVH